MANWFSVNPKEHLKGKTAIVVGGASGIGQGTAYALAAAGANVVVSGIPDETCAASAQQILDDGGIAISVPCDATDQDQLNNLVKQAVAAFDGIHILVSSCGITLPRTNVFEVDVSDWDRLFNINVTANFLLAQAVGKVMKDNEDGGRMVFVASQRGISSMPNVTPYCTTKAAVMGMIRSLAIDLAPYQITVNGIGPGYVMTDMVKKVFEELPAQEAMVLERTPLHKIGTIDEMAAAILYFCLPTASYTSGQTLILDGAWSVQ